MKAVSGTPLLSRRHPPHVAVPAALVPALALVLWGCGDLLYHQGSPDPTLLTLAYGPSLQESEGEDGIAGAFAAVDRARIVIMRSDESTLFDQVVGISRGDGEIRLQAEVELEREAATYLLLVDLRRGEDPLFEGWTEIQLRGGGVTRPEVDLDPIPAGIVFVPAAPPRITSLGDRIQLSADPAFATGHVIPGRSVEWRSLDPEVVSVSSAGEVTGLSAGSGRVEARHAGIVGVVVVEVDPEPASVQIDPSQLDVGVGQTVSLTATVRDAGGSRINASVQWSSSNTGVATVSGDGEVTGVAEGSATIEARAGDAAGQASVRVAYLPPAVETLAAADITAASARIRGRVNPLGLDTRVWFEWSFSPSLSGPQTTPPVTLEGGYSAITISHLMDDIGSGTTYYYRVVGVSSAGTSYGEIRSFTTDSGPGS